MGTFKGSNIRIRFFGFHTRGYKDFREVWG